MVLCRFYEILVENFLELSYRSRNGIPDARGVLHDITSKNYFVARILSCIGKSLLA